VRAREKAAARNTKDVSDRYERLAAHLDDFSEADAVEALRTIDSCTDADIPDHLLVDAARVYLQSLDEPGSEDPCASLYAVMAKAVPFYMPSPDMFVDPDNFQLVTTYAADLEAAGLRDHFPVEVDLRTIAIELLAERYPVKDVAAEPERLIYDAVDEAREILRRPRG